MIGRRITIQLQGLPIDEGHLRFSELIQQLEFVKNALKQTERIVSKKEEKLIYYKVVDLRHSSPATITLEAAPFTPEIKPQIVNRTVIKFFSTLREIGERGRVPSNVDLPALEAYKNLASLFDKNISQININNGNFSIALDKHFAARVTDIIGPDEIIEGSMSGMLEWLNIHNTNVFHIYPSTGPKKVNCYFPSSIRQIVISAIDRYVRVYGELRYKKRDDFPYAINVSEIDILPLDKELPSLDSLRGIATNMTGMDAADFVRSIRDANN